MFIYQVSIELCGWTAPLSFDLFSSQSRNLRRVLTRADRIVDLPKDYRLSTIGVEWIELERKKKKIPTTAAPTNMSKQQQKSPSKQQQQRDQKDKEGSSEKRGAKEDEEGPLQINFLSGNTEVTSGIIHLYRSQSRFDLKDIDVTTACIPNVPAHLASADLLEFFTLHQENILAMRLLRDAMPHRYIVLIKFQNSEKAKEFYNEYNKRPYNLMEPDICTVLFVEKIQFKVGEELKNQSPDYGLIELPTCPVCLERMDSSTTGVFSLSCNHTFHCNCLSKWHDSSCPVCRFGQNEHAGESSNECVECGEYESSLWMCLICGHIGCGRYHQGHAFQHYQNTHHPYAIEIGTQRVWDYIGDGYVHRLICNKSDGKLVELPSNSDTQRENANVEGSNSVSKDKIEAVAMEYGMLLKTQLESQRMYFQDLIAKKDEEAEAEKKKLEQEKQTILQEKKALETEAENLTREKKQFDKKLSVLSNKQTLLAKELEEERAMTKALIANQESMKKTNQEKDNRIRELEEQLKDVLFYLDAQAKVESSPMKDDIQNGQILIQEKEKEKDKKGKKKR